MSPGARTPRSPPNWSGQISTGTTYSGIHADWVVPTVQPTQYNGISATWIGIDGGPGSPGSIIQTGTQQETDGGSTFYFAWYELYPAPPVTIGGVSPGDSMTASITQDSREQLAPSRSPTSARGAPFDSGHLQRSRRLRRMDRGAAHCQSAAAQPTLANFGSVTFSDMTVQPGRIRAPPRSPRST